MIDTVRESYPVNHALPGHGWTLKKLCRWVESRLGRQVSRSTLRQILKAGGLRWKKCKKVLSKADPEKRRRLLRSFNAFLSACAGMKSASSMWTKLIFTRTWI